MKAELLSGSLNSRLKLDPRTKILLVFVINIVLIGGGITGVDFLVRIALASIPFLLLMVEGKYIVGLLYFSAFTLASFGEGFLVYHTTGIWNLLVVIISGLISRFVPSLIMGYFLVCTTTVSEFVASMERMHITQKIVIPMSVMFRFFPTIAEETNCINVAMKMRGIGGRSSGKTPLAMLEYKVVPLMMSIVKIGDELSAASLTKGLGSPCKRTNICEIGFGSLDIFLCSIGMIGFIFFAIF